MIDINHLSYSCQDYRKARDFYTDLLGVAVSNDDGRQAHLWFGDVFMIVRNSARAGAGVTVDSVGWTIADWEVHRVSAALTRHGLDAQPDAAGKSVVTKDVNGYPLRLCSQGFGSRWFV